MTDPHPADSLPPDAPRHETRDANLTTIVFVGCVLVASAVVVHVAIWGLFRYFSERDNVLKARPGLPVTFSLDRSTLPPVLP